MSFYYVLFWRDFKNSLASLLGFFVLWYSSAALDKALITELAVHQDLDLNVWHTTGVCAVYGAL